MEIRTKHKRKMETLQNDFFDYIQQDVYRYRPSWNRRPTKQWYNCYAKVDRKDKVIIWVKRPNNDGAFWIFVSISLDIISQISDFAAKQDMKDSRKFHVSLKNIQMTPIQLLDRGMHAKNPWEENWPVGIKVADNTQFQLAKKIIIQQWV